MCHTVIFTVVISASCVMVKKKLIFDATAGTGLFVISIFFHRVYKLSILH